LCFNDTFSDLKSYLILALSALSNGGPRGFHLFRERKTWSEAQTYCRSHYTDLASVRSKEEKDAIFGKIQFYQNYWIGLSRESWKWSDKSPFLLKKWGPTEGLNTYGSEYCTDPKLIKPSNGGNTNGSAKDSDS
uniref:C-type lectin domain-containing protein n=1 Tax=Periophthalmus magnuspinnatus TaxID=409849 RepID=A0A3B4ADQ7_9GOBI